MNEKINRPNINHDAERGGASGGAREEGIFSNVGKTEIEYNGDSDLNPNHLTASDGRMPMIGEIIRLFNITENQNRGKP